MHTVLFENNKGETAQFSVKDGAILFDSLSDSGQQLPHGCLAGSCGACRILVMQGAENLSKPSAIEENTIEAIRQNYERLHGKGSLDGQTIRLACRAKVKGDLSFKSFR